MEPISSEPARGAVSGAVLRIPDPRYGRPRVFSAVLSCRFMPHTSVAHPGETSGPIVEAAGPNTLRTLDFGAITYDIVQSSFRGGI